MLRHDASYRQIAAWLTQNGIQPKENFGTQSASEPS